MGRLVKLRFCIQGERKGGINISRSACLLIILLLLAVPLLAADKAQGQSFVLPKEHIQKLKRIADIVGKEIERKGIKTVTIENFTDSKGRPSARGMLMTKEFKKQFSAMKLNVMDSGTEAVVKGTLIPFKSGEKWQLSIKVVSADKNRIITSYTGIFKKPKGIKK